MNLFQEKNISENTAKRSDIDIKSIVDIAPYPVFIHYSGIIRYANSLVRKLIKVDENTDMTGWGIGDHIHPDDLPKLRQEVESHVGTEISGVMDFRIVDANGAISHAQSKSISIFFGGELCRLVHVYNFDKAEQAIEEVKEKELDLISYRNFQEKVNNTSPALITIFDLEERTSTYRSQDMAAWFKHTPETFPKKTFDIVHPDYRKEAMASLYSVAGMEDGLVQTTVYPAVQGDGSIKFLLTRSTAFQRDDSGKVTHILMVHSDITDLKEIESKLDKSEETRKAILHAIPDMVVIMDREGIIADFYPTDILRIAMKDMDMTGKNINNLVGRENAAKLKEAIEVAIDQGKLLTVNFEHEGQIQTYYMELRISRFSEDKVIIVGRDISEQKESQDKIDHYNKELFAKNQELERYITSNSELEKFAYIASHDLREPLRSLTGFAQLLQKRNEGMLTRESEEFIENIIHGAQRMNTLVSGLLEYSRITSAGKPFAVIHIPDLIKKVRSDLKISLEENQVDLILFDLPDLYCDELQMRQLFQNIVSNAIKFCSENSPIIKISAEKTERYWQFKIEDNGIGIDMRYKDQVFQIFTRLHSQDKYQGSGIGLSVCKKIVERHGGQIWLESTPGYGTTIFFTVLI